MVKQMMATKWREIEKERRDNRQYIFRMFIGWRFHYFGIGQVIDKLTNGIPIISIKFLFYATEN